MDVRTLMRRSAGFHATRTAVTADDGEVTFAEAWERGCRMASALRDLGCQPGDRVGVLEFNSLRAVDFWLGTAIAGLVRVPLYPRNGRSAHVHMLGHTDCRVLVVDERLAGEVAGITEDLPGLRHVVVRDDTYEKWLAGHSAVDPDVPIDTDDPYVIRHTGGTTGRSKGVGYTHRQWLAAGRDWYYTFPTVEPGDTCMFVGPISHAAGYMFLPTWLDGGRSLLVNGFEAGNVARLLREERVGYVFLVPTMLNLVTQAPEAQEGGYDALKVICVGGAPSTDTTLLRAREVFGDVIYQGYGQTEALPVTMGRQVYDEVPGSDPLRSVGRPLAYADLRILRLDTHEELPIGEEGEIAIQADGQMSGFWEDPEATAERIHNGFVLTGDIGRLDANGFLYVLDRKGDMIISGGFNIYPAELENVVATHPDVVEVACFAAPSERWGETPAVVATVVPGATVTEEDIVTLCAEELGSYKKPGIVVLQTDPLPRTPVGKLDRKALREPLWAGRDKRVGGS